MGRWWLGCLVLGSAWATSIPWTEDVDVDAEDHELLVDSHGTRLCVADGGRVWVAWLDDRARPGEGADVSVNTAGQAPENPASWLDAPAAAHGPRLGSAEAVSLACHEQGAALAWHDARPDGRLQLVVQVVGADELPVPGAEVVLDDHVHPAAAPQVFRHGDTVLVAWVDAERQWLLQRSDDAGSTWAPPVLVAVSVLDQPQLVRAPDGELVGVWRDPAGLHWRHSGDVGRTFREPGRLDDGSGRAAHPRVCGGGSGHWYALWQQEGAEGREIRVRYSLDEATSWGPAVRLTAGTAAAMGAGRADCVAFQERGHVVWEDDRTGLAALFHQALTAGQSDRPADVVDRGASESGRVGNSTGLTLARLRHDDGFAVAWLDDQAVHEPYPVGPYHDLYYQVYGPGLPADGDPQGPHRIDSWYSGLGSKADLGFVILGNEWYAAWTDGRYETTDVYFQHRALGERSLPPDRNLVLFPQATSSGCGR